MEKDFEKTYVGLIDILGFKEIAYNNNHPELIKIYDVFDISIKKGLAWFNKIYMDGNLKPDLKEIKINSLIISDSIILWTENLKHDQFFNLLITIRAILSQSMDSGIPVRGSIVVGPLSFREERLSTNNDNVKLTCFGRSIVDAYTLSDMQNWSGCIITADCMKIFENSVAEYKSNQNQFNQKLIENHLSIKSMERKQLLLKYLVPLKDGKLSEEYVINWINETKPKWDEFSIRKNFEKFNKPVNNWKVEIKIRNTIKFANDCPETK